MFAKRRMKMLIFVLVLLGSDWFDRCQCQQGAINLKRDLFNHYDSQSRPVQNSSEVVNVCAGLYIVQVVGLSENNQNDSFLKWNASEYDNVSQLFVKPSMIWTPDIIIMDSTEEKLHHTYRENYLIILGSQGNIKWHYQTFAKVSCKIDIINFPFDEQTCSIDIRSSARDKSMLKIIKRNLRVKVMETIKTEWFIINSYVEETSLHMDSDTVEYAVLKFTLTLRRVTTHYFLKIIIPFTIIAAITLLTFWLSPDSDKKVTLDVTILVSLVFYLQMITEYMPKGVSELPILTLYALTNFSLVFLSCVLTVIVLRFYYKPPSFLSPSQNQLPYSMRLILFKYLAPIFMLKFYFRPKHEIYLNDRCIDEKVHETLNTRTRQCFPTARMMIRDRSRRADTSGDGATTRALRVYELVQQAERVLVNQTSLIETQTSNDLPQILTTLKLVNKSLTTIQTVANTENNKTSGASNYQRQNQSQQQQQPQQPNGDDNYVSHINIKSLYYEEWKQASLVLDRLFFLLYSLLMPCTVLFFFRTNVYEYITSSYEINTHVPANNC